MLPVTRLLACLGADATARTPGGILGGNPEARQSRPWPTRPSHIWGATYWQPALAGGDAQCRFCMFLPQVTCWCRRSNMFRSATPSICMFIYVSALYEELAETTCLHWGRMPTASDRQVFVEMPSFDFLCTCVSSFDCSLWPCVYSDLDSAPNVLFPSTKHLCLL